MRAAREETVKALIAEPFDRQQFKAAQARQAETENRARQAVQDLYVKIADSLTPEERHAFPAGASIAARTAATRSMSPTCRPATRRRSAEGSSFPPSEAQSGNPPKNSDVTCLAGFPRARYALAGMTDRSSGQRVEPHGDAGGGHVALGLGRC